jgi:hypothetical protein
LGFDAAVRDPADPSRTNPLFDGGDHLHFNLAGYLAMGNAVPFEMLRDAACMPWPAPGRPSATYDILRRMLHTP